MGTAQSTEFMEKPRITETANFDFRNEPVSRNRWGELATTADRDINSSQRRGWLEEQESFQRSEDKNNQRPGSSFCWQDTRSQSSSSWLEDGMDVVKKMEKEGRRMNIYGGWSRQTKILC